MNPSRLRGLLFFSSVARTPTGDVGDSDDEDEDENVDEDEDERTIMLSLPIVNERRSFAEEDHAAKGKRRRRHRPGGEVREEISKGV